MCETIMIIMIHACVHDMNALCIYLSECHMRNFQWTNKCTIQCRVQAYVQIAILYIQSHNVTPMQILNLMDH